MYAVNWKKSMLKYRTMDSTADHNCLIKKKNFCYGTWTLLNTKGLGRPSLYGLDLS